MYAWYDDVVDRLTAIDATLPVYISDAWDLDKAVRWSRSKNSLAGKPLTPIIIDTHKYYTFDEQVSTITSHEILQHVTLELDEMDSGSSGYLCDDKGCAEVYVGEYSCALPAKLWRRMPSEQQADIFQHFGLAQTKRWQEKASGSAFWTLRSSEATNTFDDPVWDFGYQITKGTLQVPNYFLLTAGQVKRRTLEADRRRGHLMAAAMERHVNYFAKIGGSYEHWRYADGWHLGFTDARAFFTARLHNTIPGFDLAGDDEVIGADRIGALELWVLKRMKMEDAIARDRCEFVWEWEHGFRAGVRSFYEVVDGQTS